LEIIFEAKFHFTYERYNGRVDAAARIKAPSAAPSKLRNTLPPLASNELFGGVVENASPPTIHVDRANGGN
jgi:hypothetical protein